MVLMDVMINKDKRGVSATAPNEGATTQTYHIAENKLRYNYNYDLLIEEQIEKSEGAKWCQISMFVYKEIMKHVNLTNRNVKIKDRVIGHNQAYFSTKYIAKNVNGVRDRYELYFPKKSEEALVKETKKALDILVKYGAITDIKDGVVTIKESEIKSNAHQNNVYVEMLLEDIGFPKMVWESVDDAIGRYFSHKNAMDNGVPKCDIETEEEVNEKENTPIAEENKISINELQKVLAEEYHRAELAMIRNKAK